MASADTIRHALQIIGEAINVDPDDFLDHESWQFLGLSGLLASATISDLNDQVGLGLPGDAFTRYSSVGALKAHLSGVSPGNHNPWGPADPWEGIAKPKVPLSVVLQGHPATSGIIVFLFPDGSGAGTS